MATADQTLQAALTDIPPDAPPEPVEIDVEVEEGEQPPAPPAAEPPKPKQRANNAVRQALSRADEAEARALAAEERAKAAEERATKADQNAAVATATGMENYAQRIKSEADQAEAEYAAALEAGDKDVIAKAARKVAKVAAAEADVEAWRASQPAEPPPAAPAPVAPAPPPPQQIQQPSLPPEVIDFLLTNRWFDAAERNDDGTFVIGRDGRPVANPDFDEDMHDAAMLLDKGVERKIKQGLLPVDYRRTPEYFDHIRTKMAAQFPDAFEGGEEEAPPPPARRTPPMAPTRQPVAPATRSAAPNTPRTAKVTLTGETAAFVRSLVDNGTMRYSGNHDKRGKPMSYEDAYKEYARQQKLIPQAVVN